jgi:putative ABC transport system permease protein
LLRALGARSGLIVRGLIAEHRVLGGLAGLVAAIAAQTVAWVLAEQVFQIPYGPRPVLWLIGTLVGAVVVALLGWISLRPTLNTPPKTVLSTV